VHSNDALKDRTDERGREEPAWPPRADSQLVLAKGLVSAGAVEGLNNKVKRTTRKSYGFRTYEAIETSLYHNLGALPQPKFTHGSW
jgi:hypothetical protein